MRIYAETNFFLEVVFEQEEHLACEELMRLAAQGTVELAFPAFALLEPYETLIRRKKDGKGLHDSLLKQVQQLKRTASLAGEAEQLKESSHLLLRAADAAERRFQATHDRVVEVAHMVATDDHVLREAPKLGARFDLDLPDAVMLASVLKDATDRPAPCLFLNRNSKDFAQPDIIAELRNAGCELLPSFQGGIERIRHLAPAST